MMSTLKRCLLGSALALSACATPKPLVILDPSRPHQVAKEVTVTVWVCATSEAGKCKTYTRMEARLLPGDWCAPGGIVEGGIK